MNRTNQILAVVLALQVVLVGIAFWPRPAASVAGGESLFANVQASQVVRLTISDAEQNQIQLTRGASGWVLPEADDYPTLQGKVPALLDKIVGLKASRLVTQTPTSHKRLKVADDTFERRIAFTLADGNTYTLYLGTSATYQVTHVRAAGRDEVYLVSGLSTSDAGVQASDWVDTVYFSVPVDQIVAITLENANGRFEFEKGEAGVWMMKDLAADETVNENNITSLANRLSSMRMLRPLGKAERPEYGLDKPSAVVTVQTRDAAGVAKSYTLRVGAQSSDDKSYVFSSSESPYYVRMADYTVETPVTRARSDFLMLPPTPTPEPTPETSSGG